MTYLRYRASEPHVRDTLMSDQAHHSMKTLNEFNRKELDKGSNWSEWGFKRSRQLNNRLDRRNGK